MTMTQQEQEEIIKLVALCENDPLKYVQMAYPWGEGTLAGSEGPRKWQADILGKIRDHLEDKETCHSPLRIAVASGHGIGKSSLISMIVDWAMKMPDTKIVITASTDKQLKTKTMPEIEKWIKLSLTKDWFTVTATSVASLDPEHARTWRADAIPWDEDNTESFQGLHNQGKRILLVFDEGSSVSNKIYEVAEGALTDEKTQIIWLVFGNPTRGSGRFKECFGRFKHRWITYQIDSRTVEGTNKKELQDQVEAYGEDSDFVRVRVKGEFPRAGNMQFISGDLVAKARKREPYAKASDPRVMGVDVARYGDDCSVIAFRVGRDAASWPWKRLRNVDTMTLASVIVDQAKEFKPDAIFVDEGGVGGGVVDRLAMLNQPVIGVQFGGLPDRSTGAGDGDIVYANKRAEMWGYMRDWLKGGAIPDDADLEMQLTGVEYGYVIKNGKDAILLEKKADMKKRGLSSPDEADSLCFRKNTKIKTPDGEKNIQDLKIGDLVETPLGPTPIVTFWESETEALTTVKFSNGSALSGKGEHKIFVWGEGHKRLDALTLTDAVSVYGQRRLLWKFLSLLSTVDKNIQFKHLVDTIRHESSVTGRAFFTAMCGRIILDLYLKIMTFITKTNVGGIMTQRILRPNVYINIDKITQPNLFDWGYSRLPLQRLCDRLQNGMDPKRELNGINNRQRSNGLLPKQKQSPVKNAGIITKHTCQTVSIVQIPVCKKLLIELISRTKESVRGVVKNLWQTDTKQQNVVPIHVQTEAVVPTKVYNLTLRSHNAYYANDVLVYNCMTFAYEVVPSDHTAQLHQKGEQGQHTYDYDALSRDKASINGPKKDDDYRMPGR